MTIALVLVCRGVSHDGFHDALFVNPDHTSNSDNLLSHYDWDQIADMRQQLQVLFYGKRGLKANLD